MAKNDVLVLINISCIIPRLTRYLLEITGIHFRSSLKEVLGRSQERRACIDKHKLRHTALDAVSPLHRRG